jgi:hypothetical protein
MSKKLMSVDAEALVAAIVENIELLETTEGDTVECIGIENLEGILSKHLEGEFKISIW